MKIFNEAIAGVSIVMGSLIVIASIISYSLIIIEGLK